MAISNLTTVDGLRQSAETGQQIMDALFQALQQATGTSQNVDSIIFRLKSYIEALKDEEMNLLDKFNISCSNVEEGQRQLQKKFADFYSASGLINFTGAELEQLILDDYRTGVLTRNAELSRYVKEVIKPQMLEIAAEVGGETLRETVAAELNGVINNMIVEVRESGATTKFGRKVSSQKPVTEAGKILVSRLTDAQRERIEFLMKRNKQLEPFVPVISSKVHNNVVELNVNFNWYDITGGNKESYAKQLDPKELNKKNEQISSLIISKVNAHYSDLVRSYLNRMLSANPYMYFVGGNVNQITGLLGEMSALIAISELLGDRYKNKIIQWVAQNKVNAKELSIDILLKNIAGIQVKNTAKDIDKVPELRIDFAQGDANEIFNKLEKEYGIDFSQMEEIFESEAFNVPSAKKGRKSIRVDIGFGFGHGAEPDDWGEFVEAYNLMQTVIGQAQDFMTAFAPDFLYMSGGTDFQNQLANLDGFLAGGINGVGITRANTLYIVAGIPIFASSMLSDLINNLSQLQELQNKSRTFSIQSSLSTVVKKGESVPYDYVTYINSGRSNVAETRMRLTSSYGFYQK